jgi:hypothetical protein
MCLDRVDAKTKKDVKYAYKVFDTLRGKRYYPLAYEGALWRTLWYISFELYWFLYTRFGGTYDISHMYTSSKRRIKAMDGTRYRSGFHCFVNETDAKAYSDVGCITETPIVKVAIEDIVASGEQDGLDVIVARKMRLIEECQTDT